MKYNVASLKYWFTEHWRNKAHQENKMRTYIKFKSKFYPEEYLILKDETTRKALTWLRIRAHGLSSSITCNCLQSLLSLPSWWGEHRSIAATRDQRRCWWGEHRSIAATRGQRRCWWGESTDRSQQLVASDDDMD